VGPRPDPDAPAASAPLQAALHARKLGGDEALVDDARRDAFAAVLYGMAVGFASRDGQAEPPLAERVEDLATAMIRQAIGLGFRDAGRAVTAVADALASDDIDPAVAECVHTGAALAADWIGGDTRAFAARVMQLTAGGDIASGRALRPPRPR